MTGKPRLLALTSTLPASPGDGTPEFVVDVCRQLTDDYEVHLLGPHLPGAPVSEGWGDVHVHRFRYMWGRWETLTRGAILPALRSDPWRWLSVPFFLAGFLSAATRLARKLDAMVVHAYWILPAGFVARRIRRLTGIPYVVTALGADVYALENSASRSLKKRVLVDAAAVTALSEDMSRRIRDLAGVECATVPIGVSIPDESPQRQGQRILFVGRLAEKKGVDVLIRALAGVPDARATLVGEGPEEQRLRALANELRLEDRIEFAGKGTRDDVDRYLRSSSVLALPSKPAADGDQDGTPVVMCEAMATGLPVIGSELGGIGEHIEDGSNGWLVPAGSPDALRDALRRVLNDSDALRRVGENARNYAIANLDIMLTAGRYKELYGIAARGRSG